MSDIKVNVFEPQKNPDGSPAKMLGSQVLLFLYTTFVPDTTTILKELPEEVEPETQVVFVECD